MVTFKGGWGKLYHTQHSFKQCRTITLFFFFLRNKYTHLILGILKDAFNEELYEPP